MKCVLLGLLLAVLSCGGGNEGLDENGLAFGDNAAGQFTRAGQLYFRGSLSASREEFNGVVYRFPSSPLADDARLAVRRIDVELGNGATAPDGARVPSALDGMAVTVVGQTAGEAVMEWVSDRLESSGCTVNTIYDPQAPEVTVVLHRQGFEDAASVLADSVGTWLERPTVVEHQGGGGLIDAVAPEGGGVMLVIGTDAVLEQ